MNTLHLALLLYGIGAVIGVLQTDARWPVRIGIALFWPLGPLAFALTASMLIVIACIAFPLFGAIVVGATVLAALALN